MKISSAKFIKGIRGTDPILYDGTPQIAFIGRSNTGKSSLINALTGNKNLAKTGKRPGKTQEINFFEINGKWYFVDLPGYGYAKVYPREKEKIQKLIYWYLSYSNVKPLAIVLTLDIKAGLADFDKETIGILKERNHRYVIAVNKIDKLGKEELSKQLSAIREESGVLPCSAKTEEGIDALMEQLLSSR